MASSGFRIKVGLDSTSAERGLANIGRSANRLNRSMGRMAGKGLKFAAAVGAATAAMAAFAAIKFIKDSSRAAADFEMMSGSFETLLGSASAAAERIKELMAFSVKTPFEPAELIKASKMLEVMGGETLAIGKGLTMIGDAATGASEPLEVIAGHVGRMFMAMTTGQSFMEPLRELQKFGGVSKEGFEALAALNKEMVAGRTAALSNADAFKKIQGAMGQWEGEMAKAAARHGGMVSTMRGNIELLKISFGTGINKGLATGLDAMNDTLPEWLEKSKELGDTIGVGISEAIKGNTRMLELQMAWLMQKLAQIGGAVFVQALGGVFRTLIPGMIERLFELPGVEELIWATQPGTYAALKGLSQGKTNIPQVPLEQLMEASREVVGIGETETKIKELVDETKRTNRILREKREMKEYQKMVYGTLTYTMD